MKRYDLILRAPGRCDHEMEVSDVGDWVRYKDVTPFIEALRGFVDGECACHLPDTHVPCVQCVARTALADVTR
jgi:hypothetical protein